MCQLDTEKGLCHHAGQNETLATLCSMVGPHFAEIAAAAAAAAAPLPQGGAAKQPKAPSGVGGATAVVPAGDWRSLGLMQLLKHASKRRPAAAAPPAPPLDCSALGGASCPLSPPYPQYLPSLRPLEHM
jgi:hypothetical protein